MINKIAIIHEDKIVEKSEIKAKTALLQPWPDFTVVFEKKETRTKKKNSKKLRMTFFFSQLSIYAAAM